MSLILKTTLVQYDMESKCNCKMMLLYITGSVYFSVHASTLTIIQHIVTLPKYGHCELNIRRPHIMNILRYT